MKVVYKSRQLPFVTGTLICLFVFLAIVSLHNTGNLERLELAAYDWYIRLRPALPIPNSRIVLVGITESDIHAQGRWPLSDATLAQVLTKLTQYEPRAIGVNIYRDVDVPPGHAELEEVLIQHDTIIMPMFSGDGRKSIAPPSVLADTEQVGFVDILVDPDGTVRRGLLFVGNENTIYYAFALRLVLLYLQAEGVFSQSDPDNPQYLRLGPTTIRRFETNDGGYVRADARGYQFLLDFRDTPQTFPSFSLASLLSGEIGLNAIKDKIVLIGAMAESVPNTFYTPLSLGLQADQHIQGLVLHASIVSQLLRSALDGIGPMHVVSDGYEWGWIVLWALLGGVVGSRSRSL